MRLTALLVGAIALLGGAPFADAAGGAGGNDTPSTGEFAVWGSSGAPGGAGGPRCDWVPAAEINGGFGPADVTTVTEIDGVRYNLWHFRCADREGYLWVPDLTGEDLADDVYALARRRVPAPAPILSPLDTDPRGWTYVHLPTWFSVPVGQWQPVVATVSIPGLSATARATPRVLRFEPGDGELGSGLVECVGPGEVFDRSRPVAEQSSDCSYLYTHSSARSGNGETFGAAVTIVWDVVWWATDGTGGTLDPLTSTTRRDIAVAEALAVVTGTGG